MPDKEDRQSPYLQGRIYLQDLAGQVFTLFILTVAAAEVALGVAIVIAIYRNRQTVFVTDANQMRH